MRKGASGPAARQGAEPSASDLTRMLRELPDAVIIIDSVGGLLWGNKTAEQLFGRSVDEAMGLSGLDFVHPGDLDFVLLSLVSIQNKEIGAPIEVRLRTPDGWRRRSGPGTWASWTITGSRTSRPTRRCARTSAAWADRRKPRRRNSRCGCWLTTSRTRLKSCCR